MLVVGIDVSKAKIDCATPSQAKKGEYLHKQFPNSPSGFKALLQWSSSRNDPSQPMTFLMEATGTYHEKLAHFLYEQKQQVAVINPALAKHYASSLNLKAKTDRLDAQVLASYAAERPLTLWQPLPAEFQQLDVLLKRVETLQQDQQREKNRLEALHASHNPSSKVLHSIEEMIGVYDTQIQQIKKEISEVIDQDSNLKNNHQLLQSIPGIGSDTGAWLLSLLKTPAQFESASQVVAFVGLNPRIHQSGSSVKKHGSITKHGHPIWRKKLYMPAMSAIRCNPIIRKFYQNLRQRGKLPKVALIAAMRKLLHIAFGVIKNQQEFAVPT